MPVAGSNVPASIEPAIAEATRRRVARRILPFLMFAYLLAYLDRANLGIAKLHMQGELGFSDAVIGLGAGIFFVGYFLLEIPGTLIVERWSARKWLARIMITWGLIASLTGFVGTGVFGHASLTRQFYVLRFLLGTAEAGFFPGVIVYLSHWFRYEDRTRAKAFFMATQPLSLVVGLPLSRWIMENVGWYGLAGWRWLFVLEGIPAAILGVVTLFYLTDRPTQAKWLPAEEKAWLLEELDREEREKTAARRVRIWDALRQPQTLLLILVYFLVVTSNQGLIFFFPSITESMPGLSVSLRTFFTTLPYVFGMAGILLVGFSAHRTGEQRLHTAIPMLSSAAALTLAVLSGSHMAFTLTFFCLAGATTQAYLPAFWTLPTAFLGKDGAAVAIGLINSLGNLGGFAGPYLFGYLKTATGNFRSGLWVLACSTACAGLLALTIRIPRRKSLHTKQSDDNQT